MSIYAMQKKRVYDDKEMKKNNEICMSLSKITDRSHPFETTDFIQKVDVDSLNTRNNIKLSKYLHCLFLTKEFLTKSCSNIYF